MFELIFTDVVEGTSVRIGYDPLQQAEVTQFRPQTFLCTDFAAPPPQILTWFRQRWQLGVTFKEVRA